LHGSNPEPLMSALGQKRIKHVQSMSALTPEADIAAQRWGVRVADQGRAALNEKAAGSDPAA